MYESPINGAPEPIDSWHPAPRPSGAATLSKFAILQICRTSNRCAVGLNRVE